MAAADAAIGTGASTTRRGLLAFLGWSTMALVTLQAVVAFLFFFWPRKTSTFGGKVSAGSPADFKVGDVKYFVDGKFYLSRLQEGFMALYQKCPHVGCTVPWRPEFQLPEKAPGVKGLFRCPCHGSTYLPNGQIIFGPAPRPMDYMRITNEGGRLMVDTGKIQKRPSWDPAQAFKA
ncbi:MAG: ubiquinol-cytochrome c reductase iron-sulfur subunit [Chloroflexota bacterium]